MTIDPPRIWTYPESLFQGIWVSSKLLSRNRHSIRPFRLNQDIEFLTKRLSCGTTSVSNQGFFFCQSLFTVFILSNISLRQVSPQIHSFRHKMSKFGMKNLSLVLAFLLLSSAHSHPNNLIKNGRGQVISMACQMTASRSWLGNETTSSIIYVKCRLVSNRSAKE